MKKLTTILAVIFAAMTTYAQQTEITDNVHLREIAHYTVRGEVGTKLSPYDKNTFSSPIYWNIKSESTPNGREIRYWVDSAGQTDSEREWSGNDVHLFRIDRNENGVKRSTYAILQGTRQDVTVVEANDGQYVVYEPQREEEKTETEAEPRLISMNRNFNVSGTCILYSKEKLPKETDRCNLTWELRNNVIGGENYVTFSVRDSEGRMQDRASWNGGVNVSLLISDDGSKMYSVSDELFSHLRIMELSGGNYGISICSVLTGE